MNHFRELVESYLRSVEGRHGQAARPNNTMYAATLATESLRSLRRRMCSGHALTEEGRYFVASAAAYLASLTGDSYSRRGLQITFDVQYEPSADDNRVGLIASRMRNGSEEVYAQDYLFDLVNELLVPRQMFPSMKGRSYILTSLELPTPEYLYMSGSHFMLSPMSNGNWPEGENLLGLDEDFELAKEMLVDDLHKDIGVPQDDENLRRLSQWVIWPLYGWDMNDGQEYNMMTLVDQICFKEVVPRDVGVAYLRQLLTSQCYPLRNLAARTLLVLGEEPESVIEEKFFRQSLSASDYSVALQPMVKYAWNICEPGNKEAPTQEFATEMQKGWQELARSGPKDPCYESPVFTDPQYAAYRETDMQAIDERLSLATELLSRYPKDWFAKVAFASALLPSDREAEGVAMMETLLQEPLESVGHFTLSGHFVQNEEFDKADALYLDLVKRWPWDYRAVGNAMWSITRTMTTEAPEEVRVS